MHLRLHQSLLVIALTLLGSDKVICAAEAPNAVKCAIAKQKFVPLAFQYRLKLLKEIEGTTCFNFGPAPHVERACLPTNGFTVRTDRNHVSLAFTEPSSWVMSIQV